MIGAFLLTLFLQMETVPLSPPLQDTLQDTLWKAQLQRAQKRFSQVQTLQAYFLETIRYAGAGQVQRFRGTLYFKRPTFVRIEVDSPAKQILISDGAVGWLYLPAQGVAYKRDLASLGVYADPRAFFFDVGEAFEVYPRPSPGSGPVFLLVPKGEVYAYDSVRVRLDPKTSLPREVTLYAKGATATFQLVGVAENPEIPEDRFRFVPPPGVEVR